ncbi:MAG TPA: tetratricopeptide repeat protein [Myxococcota bacterium]|nr:tetratricopeptide repeat protein [Myxococcota bacterium]
MRRLLVLLVCLALPSQVFAGESFAGQNDLAAGLNCYREMDMRCARARLESALSHFSPENDSHYIDHVSQARLMLAMIHVAADELEKAEGEFKTILLLDPEFKLPIGEHPPKVIYIFKRAQTAFEAARKKETVVTRPPVKKTQPEPTMRPRPPVIRKVPTQLSHERVFRPWSISPEARFVVLFGDDAGALAAGPGAALSAAFRPFERLAVQAGFSYAHHASTSSGPALQTVSLSMGACTTFSLDPVEFRAGGSLGVLSMGTADRYDHWGFTLGLATSVSWPTKGPWALVVSLYPSLVITAGGSSFFLPIGLSGEIRW